MPPRSSAGPCGPGHPMTVGTPEALEASGWDYAAGAGYAENERRGEPAGGLGCKRWMDWLRCI